MVEHFMVLLGETFFCLSTELLYLEQVSTMIHQTKHNQLPSPINAESAAYGHFPACCCDWQPTLELVSHSRGQAMGREEE